MTMKSAQVDKLLTDVSQKRSLGTLVYPMILTPKKVVQYSGKIGKYGADHLRLVNMIAGGENGYVRMDPQTRTSSTYQIETKGLKDVLVAEDYANVEQPFDAKVDSTDALTDLINLANEYSLASALSDTSVLTQNVTLSGTSQWSDYDNSDPIADIALGIKTVKTGCGMPADRAVCSWEVFEMLRFHTQVMDKLGFKYDRPGGVNKEELAKALGLKEILVADSSYNTAAREATAVFAPVWGKNFILFRSEAAAAKRQTTLGYNVTLASGDKKVVVKPQDEPLDSDKIIIEDKRDQIITDTGCGYLIKAAIA